MADCVPYKRHLPPCTSTSRAYTRCDCPAYAQGNIVGSDGVIEYVNRKSLHTTDIAVARKIVRTWHINGTSRPLVAKTGGLVLETAAQEFINTRKASVKEKYALLLLKRLVPFCGGRGINQVFLADVTYETLELFVAGWINDPRVNALTQGRLKAFFKWCVVHEKLAKDPSIRLAKIEHEHTQKQPFSPDEMARIIAACSRFSITTRGKGHRVATPTNMLALVLLMRWVGIRISDAVVLRWSNITADGWIDFIAQKNKAHVRFPIHPDALAAMKAIERDETDYVFWRSHRSPKDKQGKTKESAKYNWLNAFTRIFELAKVENATSHRFRHTCAVQALVSGVPTEEVALMLGDTVETVTTFYSAKTAEREKRLAALVSRQWAIAV